MSFKGSHLHRFVQFRCHRSRTQSDSGQMCGQLNFVKRRRAGLYKKGQNHSTLRSSSCYHGIRWRGSSKRKFLFSQPQNDNFLLPWKFHENVWRSSFLIFRPPIRNGKWKFAVVLIKFWPKWSEFVLRISSSTRIFWQLLQESKNTTAMALILSKLQSSLR